MQVQIVQLKLSVYLVFFFCNFIVKMSGTCTSVVYIINFHLLIELLFLFTAFQPPPTDFPVHSITSSAQSLQGQTPPPTGVPVFTKGALPGVRPMYPPASLSTPQSAGTVPASSVYGPPGTLQSSASAMQPGTVPTYPPSAAVTNTQQYSTPPLSKPTPMGIRNAAVTGNYAGSLSDGFNSMHLQVCIQLLLVGSYWVVHECGNVMIRHWIRDGWIVASLPGHSANIVQ